MIKRFFKDEEGVTAVTKGILLALIAAAIIIAAGGLGDTLSSFFASLADLIESEKVSLIESKVSYRNEFF